MRPPIERCVEDWHRHLRGELPGGLDAILADDVVFLSPIVFSPQRGKQVTKLYLSAAGATIGGGAFRYVKEVLSGRHAVLEFETELAGKYVNGIDLLTERMLEHQTRVLQEVVRALFPDVPPSR